MFSQKNLNDLWNVIEKAIKDSEALIEVTRLLFELDTTKIQDATDGILYNMLPPDLDQLN